MSRSVNRDRAIRLSVAVFAVWMFGQATSAEGLPDDEQVAKMAAAAWKDKPESIDATVYKTITTPPKPYHEIRKRFESSFANERKQILERHKPDSRARTIMLEKLNRTIEMNVQITLKEQQHPRRIKTRIRISAGRERHDSAYAMTLDVLLGPNTPFDATAVDLGKRAAGDIRAFGYEHRLKIANIKTSGWKASHIEEFTGLPAMTKLGWKMLMGKKTSSGLYVSDLDKMEEIARTGVFSEGYRLTIGPEPNFPAARDRIEVKNPEVAGRIVLICDRADYSRVYSIRSYQHKTGRLLRVRECSNFDSQGFPHNVTVIEYDADGKLKKKEAYRFAKVVLNPAIPDEVFEFRPPEGYKVNDRRPKNPETEKSAPEPTPSP